MRRRTLVAVADLEPIEVLGTFERHSSLRRDALQGSASGGRWGARNAYEVLYLGRPRASVVIEAYRQLVEDELDAPADLAAAVLERRVATCQVAVPDVLDLRPLEAQQALGLADGALLTDVGDYESCQSVGAAAHQLRRNGVLAPAATGRGETLALFSANLPAAHWPTVVATDIWHGLPPDPRKFGLADETG